MRRVDGRELVAVFVGGFVGALARLWLIEALPEGPLEWPWATFLANIVGAFALGWFATRLQERLPVSAYRRPLLGTGFCGALTTFSTMQLEIVHGWSAVLWDAKTQTLHQSQRYVVRLVDRIGGGDSFAAGLIYSMLTGRPLDAALRFAVAASALKQTIPGDFNRVTVADVDALAAGDASGRVQR